MDIVSSKLWTGNFVNFRSLQEGRNTICKLKKLSATGLQISIDDFGTGFSSLAYLLDLPVNEVKIDKSFIFAMIKDPKAEKIVETIISMAQHLGLFVIAEGVETIDQRDRLINMGCSRFQGYLFHQPVAQEDYLQQICVKDGLYDGQQ